SPDGSGRRASSSATAASKARSTAASGSTGLTGSRRSITTSGSVPFSSPLATATVAAGDENEGGSTGSMTTCTTQCRLPWPGRRRRFLPGPHARHRTQGRVVRRRAGPGDGQPSPQLAVGLNQPGDAAAVTPGVRVVLLHETAEGLARLDHGRVLGNAEQRERA